LCLDNFITGSEANIQEAMGNASFTLLRRDISQHITISEDIDIVFHLASPASPMDYLRLPIQTLTTGSYGTHNALELARAKGARFVLASTSEVYGDPLEHPQTEAYWGNVNPIGPRSVYDEAKRYAEALGMAYRRFHGVSVRIARIFNTYGPRMRLNDGRVVPTFLRQALRREPLLVYGDGSQTRSFCYVSDLIDGLLRLAEIDYGLPVNLGNPQEITILEFAAEVARQCGIPLTTAYAPLPEDDPQRRCPSISRAKEILGWEPKVVLADGLKLTLAYFRSVTGGSECLEAGTTT
jgi:dTDP-glucose 4,6-dehydratase